MGRAKREMLGRRECVAYHIYKQYMLGHCAKLYLRKGKKKPKKKGQIKCAKRHVCACGVVGDASHGEHA